MTDKDLADRVRAAGERWNTAIPRLHGHTRQGRRRVHEGRQRDARKAGLTVGPEYADIRTGTALLAGASCAAPQVCRSTPL